MEMKQELQGQLVEILTSIQTAAGKASDFALGQLPDIAQSYVAYGRVTSIVGVLLGAALLAVACWAIRWIWEQNKGRRDFDEPFGLNVFGGLGSVAMGLVGIVMLVDSLNAAFLVWLAPKVWLLKEIATLVK